MVLTLAEVAQQLRCSKAFVSNLVNGKLRNVPPLPAVRIGRRVIVRQAALDSWMLSLEQAARQELQLAGAIRGNLKSPESIAVKRMKGKTC